MRLGAVWVIDKTGQQFYGAEFYCLKGELLLNDERRMMNDERRTQQARAVPHAVEAEVCFHKAIEIARHQEPNPGNCAPRPASPGCGSSRAGKPKPASCSLVSITGSPKALTRRTSKMQKLC